MKTKGVHDQVSSNAAYCVNDPEPVALTVAVIGTLLQWRMQDQREPMQIHLGLK